MDLVIKVTLGKYYGRYYSRYYGRRYGRCYSRRYDKINSIVPQISPDSDTISIGPMAVPWLLIYRFRILKFYNIRLQYSGESRCRFHFYGAVSKWLRKVINLLTPPPIR
jgi:hypothetical protein